MQTPYRKAGKFTNLKPDTKLTPQKFAKLTAELEKLIKLVRPKLIIEVQHGASFGDFSENASYQIAKGRLRGINERISELEHQLKHAQIITAKNLDTVQLGHTVEVEVCSGRDAKFCVSKYTILGSSETDPGRNIISDQSALGKALLGAKVGQIVTINLANKKMDYKIIKITNSSL